MLLGISEGSTARAISCALSVHALTSFSFSSQTALQEGVCSLAAAVNNLSICCLYVKQIRTAIYRLELLIMENPARFLSDPVVFNLCTLYDLSYAPDASVMKKKVLQRVASEYGVDDPILHWRSFRLN
jgi:hypothetical protein